MHGGSHSKERRKYVRIGSDVGIKVEAVEKTDQPLMGRARNISAEGICFSSDRELNPGDTLRLEFFVPQDSKPIRLKGEVVWSSKMEDTKNPNRFDTGVKLLDISKTDENRFLVYVCDKMVDDLSKHIRL